MLTIFIDDKTLVSPSHPDLLKTSLLIMDRQKEWLVIQWLSGPRYFWNGTALMMALALIMTTWKKFIICRKKCSSFHQEVLRVYQPTLYQYCSYLKGSAPCLRFESRALFPPSAWATLLYLSLIAHNLFFAAFFVNLTITLRQSILVNSVMFDAIYKICLSVLVAMKLVSFLFMACTFLIFNFLSRVASSSSSSSSSLTSTSSK